MIHRKFDKLKFTRTYIGGSKQREIEIFTEVQGTKEDNSECNWLEYRRMLRHYLDDILNILLSWRYVLGIVSIIFAVIALILTFGNPYLGIIVLFFSLITHSISRYLNRKEQKILSAYNFSLELINQETGLNLAKN
jgi:ABC-type multidrug transport system fused ATPase/permease subunit